MHSEVNKKTAIDAELDTERAGNCSEVYATCL